MVLADFFHDIAVLAGSDHFVAKNITQNDS